ncbi:MAG TPA: DUF1294 domain-containing protein [Anaerolineae bacterium]|jgi:uncharacterized membrane protein YsdA (DUF1294 family)
MRLSLRYAALAITLTLVTMLLLATLLKVGWVAAWLIAISAVAFLVYGYDKLIAGTDRMRVPEQVLLLLAFIGGTPGALAGMQIFRHKTSKQTFQQQFWLVVLVQIIVGVVVLVLHQRIG